MRRISFGTLCALACCKRLLHTEQRERGMASYVFIASGDPEHDQESRQVFELAGSLSRERNLVSVYLTADAVAAARSEVGERWLNPLLQDRVRVFADPLALKQRGIGLEVIVTGVVPAAIEALVERWAA
jgi:sulfur relay (sulfurtransferase) complex TusBCD TusD component (DsrE family)